MEDNYIPSLSFTLCVQTNKQTKEVKFVALQEKWVDFHEKYIACKDKEQVKTKTLIR